MALWDLFMDYQAKFKNLNQACPTKLQRSGGFTLVETIVVLGIFTLLIGMGNSVYINFKSHNNLEIATYSVVEALRHAKSNTEQVQGDSPWGVKIFTDKVVVFKGTSYASRVTSADQTLNLPGGITTGGLSEIIFEKVTGTTATVGTVTLSGTSGSKNISINAKGTISY